MVALCPHREPGVLDGFSNIERVILNTNFRLTDKNFDYVVKFQQKFQLCSDIPSTSLSCREGELPEVLFLKKPENFSAVKDDHKLFLEVSSNRDALGKLLKRIYAGRKSQQKITYIIEHSDGFKDEFAELCQGLNIGFSRDHIRNSKTVVGSEYDTVVYIGQNKFHGHLISRAKLKLVIVSLTDTSCIQKSAVFEQETAFFAEEQGDIDPTVVEFCKVCRECRKKKRT